MKKEMIKVIMADDHILLRNALASLIDKSDSCKVIAEASNGKELIDSIQKDNYPDIAILDLNMPVMDGHETAQYLQKHHPKIKVLMLTMYDSELVLIRLLKAGVKGFMKKDIHPKELIHALQVQRSFLRQLLPSYFDVWFQLFGETGILPLRSLQWFYPERAIEVYSVLFH